jgi:acetyltransferase-like isoleucine patch superfamily enzyme
MKLGAELSDLLTAIRGQQRAYRTHALGPRGERVALAPDPAKQWRERLVYYRFLRKVRTWKQSGVRFGHSVIAMPSVDIDTSLGWLISIGDRTRLGGEVRIICHDASAQRDCGWGRVGPVTIGRDCVLNERVLVLAGVTIGDGCLIGSGSVVVSDIPAGSRAMGAPARVYGRAEDYLREQQQQVAQSPCFDYRELYGLSPAQREEAMARMRAAGGRGFHFDPFSQTLFWVTPPEETPEPVLGGWAAATPRATP